MMLSNSINICRSVILNIWKCLVTLEVYVLSWEFTVLKKRFMRMGYICEWYRGRKNWEPLIMENHLFLDSVALNPSGNTQKTLWLLQCNFILLLIHLKSIQSSWVFSHSQCKPQMLLALADDLCFEESIL